MKNSVKTDHIEYKIYENGKHVHKRAVCRRYPTGRILICQDLGEALNVICEVKTDFENPAAEIEDIRKLPLPSSAEKCVYVAVFPKDENESAVDGIRRVIDGLETRDMLVYNNSVFLKNEPTLEKAFFIIANTEEGSEDAFCKDYGIQSFKEKCEPAIERLYEQIVVEPGSILKAQIQLWAHKTSFKEFEKEIEKTVQGQKELSSVVFHVYHYLTSIANGQAVDKQSIILAGPSGCGKTETYRALKKYFEKEIPPLVVDLIDTNQITGEGYKGKDTNHIVSALKKAKPDGIGIVFLDEFDKRLIPSHSSHGDDVNRGIQGQLLLAIEGCNLDGIDTSNTLFIGMGSFNEAREKRRQEKHIGFGVERTDAACEHYSPITREEMIKLGASYELIGRFGHVINYGPLSPEALDRIIDMRASEVSESYGVRLSISDSMRAFLHQNSNTEFGNRLIESLIREAATRAMIEILSEEISAEEIVITGKDSYIIKKAVKEEQDQQREAL